MKLVFDLYELYGNHRDLNVRTHSCPTRRSSERPSRSATGPGNGREVRMARLLGKVAVITGAGSGIGRASAARFAREGAVVVMADVKGDAVEAAAAEIAAAWIPGGRAVPVVADVSKEADVRALFDGAAARPRRLDPLSTNARAANR